MLVEALCTHESYSNGTGFDQGPLGRVLHPLHMERGASSLCNQESGDRKVCSAPKPREMAAQGVALKRGQWEKDLERTGT